jgi:hypothetical protein
MTQSMGEVTIICLTDLVHIQDIGVRLTRGHRVNIPLSVATKSRDLSAAKLDGTVTIQTLRTAATVRAQEFASSDTTISTAPRHTPGVVVEYASILAALERLTEEVQGLRVDITRLHQQSPGTGAPARDVSRLLAMLEERIQNPMVTVRGSTPTEHVLEAPAEMYIPSNLTGGVTAPDLKVASETSTSPQITGTAEALKAARKKR